MAKIEVVPESDQDDHTEEDKFGIPLTRPSDLGEIPHDEQMRLIKDTGILDQLPAKNAEQLAPLADSILDTGIIAIPLSTLYIVLDLLVQQQYAQQPTIKEEFGRVITNVPMRGKAIGKVVVLLPRSQQTNARQLRRLSFCFS
ncbi:hypothetical protein V565_027840 [Rhizoctonia solani 123E]|uniref:Uncharacterized protein n=1 Tax=Rhizoctonia solani 123E TaxID=1423351 RepID=A0A074S358_9AGAM|nr:hypothetical protein V565_027840 [Rhizoctonia solani 123E]